MDSGTPPGFRLQNGRSQPLPRAASVLSQIPTSTAFEQPPVGLRSVSMNSALLTNGQRPRIARSSNDQDDKQTSIGLGPRALIAAPPGPSTNQYLKRGKGARIAPESVPATSGGPRFFASSGLRVRSGNGNSVLNYALPNTHASVGAYDSNHMPSLARLPAPDQPPESPPNYSNYMDLSPLPSPGPIVRQTLSRSSNYSDSSGGVLRAGSPVLRAGSPIMRTGSPMRSGSALGAYPVRAPVGVVKMAPQPRMQPGLHGLGSPAGVAVAAPVFINQNNDGPDEYDDDAFDEDIDDFYNSESDQEKQDTAQPKILLKVPKPMLVSSKNGATGLSSDGGPTEKEDSKQVKDLRVKQARSDRKIMDLEISNESLMKVNKYLEKRLRSQAKHIQKTKLAQTSSRFLFSNALKGEYDSGEFSDEDDEEEEEEEEEDEEEYGQVEEEDDDLNRETTPEEDIARKTRLIEKRMQSHIKFLESSEKVNKQIHSCLFISEALILQATKSLGYEVDPSEVKLAGQATARAFDDIGEASFQEGDEADEGDAESGAVLATIEENQEEEEPAKAEKTVPESDSDDGDYSAFKYKNRVQTTFTSFLPLDVMDEIEKEIDGLIDEETGEGRADDDKSKVRIQIHGNTDDDDDDGEIERIPVAERIGGIVDDDEEDDAQFALRNPALQQFH